MAPEHCGLSRTGNKHNTSCSMGIGGADIKECGGLKEPGEYVVCDGVKEFCGLKWRGTEMGEGLKEVRDLKR
jgi:hypothetical protein